MKLLIVQIKLQIAKVKAVWTIFRLNVPIGGKIRLLKAGARAYRNAKQMRKKLLKLRDGQYVATAPGDYLDIIGAWRGLKREPEEGDEEYRARIRRAIMRGEIFGG